MYSHSSWYISWGHVSLAMAFKLVLAAEKRWRKVNAPHLVALVHAGVEFKDGEQVLHYYQVAPLVLEQVPVEAAA